MKERIHGATIAQNGTVSYEGSRPSYSGSGERVTFNVSTYDKRERFDWTRLPRSCPVIDLEGGDIVTIWRELISHDHPSFSAKCETARNAGFKVTTAGRLTA